MGVCSPSRAGHSAGDHPRRRSHKKNKWQAITVGTAADQGRWTETEKMNVQAVSVCGLSDLVMEDALRPSKIETQRLLANSLHTWESYKHTMDGKEELPFDSINLLAMLGHVPAFLGVNLREHPLQHYLEQIEYEASGELWVTGKSTWHTTIGDCNLPKKVLSQKLLLGISSRTICSFTEENRFQDWPGVENVEKSAKGNSIAILTLAWCYIFSAKWIEMQSPSSPDSKLSNDSEQLAYLNDVAQWSADDRTKNIDINLGGVDDDAGRWWAAVLAPGDGWQASIVRFGRRYLSPWSMRLSDQQSFILRRTLRKSQEAGTEPPYVTAKTAPSSTMALQYLSDFCDLHLIHGQCFAALAATLLIPYHAGAEQLLLPRPRSCAPPHSLPTSSPLFKLREQEDLLPFYMTLSCDIRGVRPLLHSSLFEAKVSCNLVSPWLQGAFETINILIRDGEYSKLAAVMAKRQPKVAAIWLGAIILGMESQILRPIRAGMFAVDMITAAWTCTAHSFIGPRQLIPFKHDNSKISRSDESRLLYLVEAEGHSRVPVCPWEPFGETDLLDTDVEVREHTNCGGHHCLQYEDWTWDLRNGGCSDADKGFYANENFTDTNENKGRSLLEPLYLHDDRLEISEDLSANATRSIFGWLRATGYPFGEQEIWKHPWLNIGDEEEEDEEIPESSSTDSKQASSVEKWLLNPEIG